MFPGRKHKQSKRTVQDLASRSDIDIEALGREDNDNLIDLRKKLSERPAQKQNFEKHASAQSQEFITDRGFAWLGRHLDYLLIAALKDNDAQATIRAHTHENHINRGQVLAIAAITAGAAVLSIIDYVNGDGDDNTPDSPEVSCTFSTDQPYTIEAGQGYEDIAFSIQGITPDGPCLNEAEMLVVDAISNSQDSGQIGPSDTIYIPGSVEVVTVSE